MKKFEYEVRETEFAPTSKLILAGWLCSYGSDGWRLIIIQPIQVFDQGSITKPGQINMRLTFLCVFERRKSWLRKFLYRVKE
jgi:hypothetical protein